MDQPQKAPEQAADKLDTGQRTNLTDLFEEAQALQTAEAQVPNPGRHQYEAIYHPLVPDGDPIGMKYEGQTPQGVRVEIPQDYYLPQQLQWVGGYTLDNLADLERDPAYFHGSRESRIMGIKGDGGLKKFEEPSARAKLHSVYATPDPNTKQRTRLLHYGNDSARPPSRTQLASPTYRIP